MSGSLVAYFSITGVTESVAVRLARILSADLFEVIPQPGQDLSMEKKIREGKQEVRFAHKDISPYERIYVGLPIWWYAAPTVIHDFLSSYDLTGKILIPFATSGGGGLDKIRPRLQESCSGADLREASLLLDTMSDQELAAWAERME